MSVIKSVWIFQTHKPERRSPSPPPHISQMDGTWFHSRHLRHIIETNFPPRAVQWVYEMSNNSWICSSWARMVSLCALWSNPSALSRSERAAESSWQNFGRDQKRSLSSRAERLWLSDRRIDRREVIRISSSRWERSQARTGACKRCVRNPKSRSDSKEFPPGPKIILRWLRD